MSWCVEHRDGWCRVKGGRRPSEAATSVPTACGQFVTLPWGIENREPTCTECGPARQIMGKTK